MKSHFIPARKSSARLFSALGLSLAAAMAGTGVFAQTTPPANPADTATPATAPMAAAAAPAGITVATPPVTAAAPIPVVPSAASDIPSGIVRPPSMGDAIPTQPPPPPRMPLDFAEFAPDYQPKELLHPRWLSVQIGTVETPESSSNQLLMFQRSNLLDSNLRPIEFHPIEMECLYGVKCKFERVAMIDHDPKGNPLVYRDPKGTPLKYSVPMGTVAYFLAMDDDQSGFVDLSFFYYDVTGLDWINDPLNYGAYLPTTTGIWKHQKILKAPAEKYIFIYSSQRVGSPRAGSTAQPVILYTYLVLFIHRMEGPTAPTATSTTPWSN